MFLGDFDSSDRGRFTAYIPHPQAAANAIIVRIIKLDISGQAMDFVGLGLRLLRDPSLFSAFTAKFFYRNQGIFIGIKSIGAYAK
jgi:hypothetical protein